MTTQTNDSILQLTANIVASHLSHNPVSAGDVPALITSVYRSLSDAMTQPTAEEPVKPAVPIKQSVFDDRIVCLECGQSFRLLKRHINTEHGMTEDAYRDRFKLSADYPLVAPEYAEVRSRLAKQIGLGTTKSRHITRRITGPKAAAR